MDTTEKTIKDKFDSLPLNIKTAIDQTPWKNIVSEISKENNFSIEKTMNLETETMLVLYGFEDIENYPSNLIRELRLEDNKTVEIAEEVDKKVFLEIEKKATENLKVAEPASINLSEFKEIEPPKPELLISVPSYTQTPATTPGENLPTIVETKKFGYGGNVDPYREPTN